MGLSVASRVLLLVALCPLTALCAEAPPTVLPIPAAEENYHALESGVPFTLQCQAKGEPSPEIEWFRDDVK